jgi:hypothetical protein
MCVLVLAVTCHWLQDDSWQGNISNTAAFAQFMLGQKQKGVHTSVSVTNKQTQEVTMYSTCHPQVHAARTTDLDPASEEDCFLHLVADHNAMQSFLTSQDTAGIQTSVCLHDAFTCKVCVMIVSYVCIYMCVCVFVHSIDMCL